MLSSTAKNLYWMGRYLHRAKNTARVLESTQRMALQSGTAEAGAVADIYALRAEFLARHPQGTLADLLDFMTLDESNPSSLINTVRTARNNARAERNNLTVDVWESLNGLWLEVAALGRLPRAIVDSGALLELVKKQTTLIAGATQSTLLRDDAYCFLQLGSYLERADNTARVLDVKFHRLCPDGDPRHCSTDYYEWSEILACIGAVRTYRRIYHSRIEPTRVVDLMVLRRDLPRSVHHCLWQVDLNMRELADTYGTRGEADRQAGALHAHVRYGRVEDLFATGLRPYLEDLGERIVRLSDEIGRQFLFA
ncbi:MAG: alpha-E domain-containing protein [Alphaproteobacteria bacterium]|nr:alpha-E domain-containing protein [Alphaproteobacteria bacterium]